MKRIFLSLAILAGAYGGAIAQKAYWHAAINIQGHELPFGLIFANEQGKEVVYIQNAAEKIKVDELTHKGDSLFMHLPVFDSEIRAKQTNDTLSGFWYNYAKGKKHVFHAVAFHLQSPEWFNNRFKQIGPATRDFNGKWEVDFSPGTADSSKAIAIFSENANQISGTFLTPTGDYRYLQGNENMDTIWLSCFDGSHAFLFRAELQHDGTLKGRFWSGASWNEPWVARRNNNYELPDPDKLTYLKPGYDGLSFTFNDLNGQRVSLSDEKFKGKVVLVQLMGSWCPNCMDETAFLAPYYRKHASEGFEIIGLAYERGKDPEKSRANVKRLKARFGVDYTLLLAGMSDKTEAAKTLPMLNQVLGYPTTIFIDKKGRVRRIYTGYNGPATGKYHEKFVSDFENYVAQLLKEK